MADYPLFVRTLDQVDVQHMKLLMIIAREDRVFQGGAVRATGGWATMTSLLGGQESQTCSDLSLQCCSGKASSRMPVFLAQLGESSRCGPLRTTATVSWSS